MIWYEEVLNYDQSGIFKRNLLQTQSFDGASAIRISSLLRIFLRLPIAAKALWHNPKQGRLLLYGLLLDRMELSYRNGWVDDQNRVFIIFTVEEVMETLRCRSEKAVRLFAELDSKKGIGLIERKRQGLGKPAIIYVKNFAGDIS